MAGRDWHVWGVVVRWIDGDTLVARLDLGWGVWHYGKRGEGVHIRLLDIDAPERGQPGFDDARVLMEARYPIGSTIRVESRAVDSFGRVLGTISLPNDR